MLDYEREKENESLKIQQGTNERPGIGALLRSIATLIVMPSSFEPCGLVQYEGWLFGSLAFATNTGGLADTIFVNPNQDNFNGFLFERMKDWNSKEQDSKIRDKMTQAIHYLMQLSSSDRVR